MVSAAAGGGLESPAEIRHGERGDLLVDPEFDGGGIKRVQSGAQLGEKIFLLVDLVVVRIEPAQGAEKYLPAESQCAAHLENLRHLKQLPADATGRKLCRQVARGRQRIGKRLAINQRIRGNRAGSLDQ